MMSLFASTKVHNFLQKWHEKAKKTHGGDFYIFFNISEAVDFQPFAKKLQKEAKKSR